MSFLANLRQEHADKQSLRLIYSISISHIEPQLHLELALQDNLNSKKNGFKAYKLNREHLKTPPAFLSNTDRNILKSLIDLDEKNLNKNNLSLSPSTSWSLLQSIINTQRCFYRNARINGELTPVIDGKRQTAKPRWALV